jgi:hypothetical protein
MNIKKGKAVYSTHLILDEYMLEGNEIPQNKENTGMPTQRDVQ